MPTQVLPINDLASIGVIEDVPSVILPPNAFSDVQNVRFHNNAINKLPGEDVLSSGQTTNNKYVAYWAHPTAPRYVVVTHEEPTTTEVTATVSLFTYDGTNFTLVDFHNMQVGPGYTWQHTMFNGGFAFILNNGTVTPRFLLEDFANFPELPNWDSYQSQEEITEAEWDVNNDEFPLGRNIPLQGATNNFDGYAIDVTIIPRNPSIDIITYSIASLPSAGDPYSIDTTDPNNWIFTPAARTSTVTMGALQGDTVRVVIRRIPEIRVTAGVIRSYGNLLVAGNLMEVDRTTPTTVIRNMAGVIRTSDVAAPGQIPLNWNPFRIGANTADEFTLSSTGTVQDLVELQGILYVYTDTSIHSIQQTNSPTIPFQITPVTFNYGANNTGSVIEFDGRHVVVGSNDVYLFGGHPGSIQSIANGRVRYTDFFQNREVTQILRFNKYDELWFWSPDDINGNRNSQMYMWNYRTGVWSKRNQSPAISANVSPLGPVIATSNQIRTVDNEGDYTYSISSPSRSEDLGSFVERRRLALTPEFNTETMASVVLLIDGDNDMRINVVGSNVPGDETANITGSTDKNFDIGEEYKQDIRVHGRLLNYRLSHHSDSVFRLSGMQLEIAEGGTR